MFSEFVDFKSETHLVVRICCDVSSTFLCLYSAASLEQISPPRYTPVPRVGGVSGLLPIATSNVPATSDVTDIKAGASALSRGILGDTTHIRIRCTLQIGGPGGSESTRRCL